MGRGMESTGMEAEGSGGTRATGKLWWGHAYPVRTKLCVSPRLASWVLPCHARPSHLRSTRHLPRVFITVPLRPPKTCNIFASTALLPRSALIRRACYSAH